MSDDPPHGAGAENRQVGALGAASRFLTIIAVEWIIGMEWDLILQHALISSACGVVFGVLGSLMAPPIVRNLIAHGLIASRPGMT